jgi:hypothetical protein
MCVGRSQYFIHTILNSAWGGLKKNSAFSPTTLVFKAAYAYERVKNVYQASEDRGP